MIDTIEGLRDLIDRLPSDPLDAMVAFGKEFREWNASLSKNGLTQQENFELLLAWGAAASRLKDSYGWSWEFQPEITENRQQTAEAMRNRITAAAAAAQKRVTVRDDKQRFGELAAEFGEYLGQDYSFVVAEEQRTEILDALHALRKQVETADGLSERLRNRICSDIDGILERLKEGPVFDLGPLWGIAGKCVAFLPRAVGAMEHVARIMVAARVIVGETQAIAASTQEALPPEVTMPLLPEGDESGEAAAVQRLD